MNVAAKTERTSTGLSVHKTPLRYRELEVMLRGSRLLEYSVDGHKSVVRPVDMLALQSHMRIATCDGI